MPAGRRV